MESPRDPLPAYVSAEPDPAAPPPAVPRPRDPGESTEPLRLDESPEPLPLSDADLIAACRAGDAAAAARTTRSGPRCACCARPPAA